MQFKKQPKFTSMKKIIIILMLAFSVVASAHDFKIENSVIVWQKVFEGAAPVQLLSDVIKTDSTIVGKIVKHNVNYQAQGYNSMSATFMVQDLVNGNVTIDVKGNRYRVTVRNIVFLNTNAALGPIDNPATAEYWFLKKGEFTTRPAIMKGLVILQTDFESIFKEIVNKTDW